MYGSLKLAYTDTIYLQHFLTFVWLQIYSAMSILTSYNVQGVKYSSIFLFLLFSEVTFVKYGMLDLI